MRNPQPPVKKESASQFYVGIKNPKELRRNLLEASKAVLESMQTHQRIIQIQKEKRREKEKLREDIKELKMLFSRLEKCLPENTFDTGENVPTLPQKRQEQKPKISDEDAEYEKIHRHLEIIEQRIKNLK